MLARAAFAVPAGPDFEVEGTVDFVLLGTVCVRAWVSSLEGRGEGRDDGQMAARWEAPPPWGWLKWLWVQQVSGAVPLPYGVARNSRHGS